MSRFTRRKSEQTSNNIPGKKQRRRATILGGFHGARRETRVKRAEVCAVIQVEADLIAEGDLTVATDHTAETATEMETGHTTATDRTVGRTVVMGRTERVVADDLTVSTAEPMSVVEKDLTVETGLTVDLDLEELQDPTGRLTALIQVPDKLSIEEDTEAVRDRLPQGGTTGLPKDCLDLSLDNTILTKGSLRNRYIRVQYLN